MSYLYGELNGIELKIMIIFVVKNFIYSINSESKCPVYGHLQTAVNRDNDSHKFFLYTTSTPELMHFSLGIYKFQ